jgi:hypothetical protein
LGFQEVNTPRFQDNRQVKVVRSALAPAAFTPSKYSLYSFRHSAAGRITSIKNSNDTIGNRTRDLPACSAVPQPTAQPRVPCATGKWVICYRRFGTLYRSHLQGSRFQERACSLTSEEGTVTLCRNVSNKLPIFAAHSELPTGRTVSVQKITAPRIVKEYPTF